MWGGFLYSKNHINRDGACFSTQSGKIIDILSLLATGMYPDKGETEEDNQYGEDSIEVSSNSYRRDH